jgi:hypothetical protein
VQDVRKQLFAPEVIQAIQTVADHSQDSPQFLAVAAFATLFSHTLTHGSQDNPLLQSVWTQLPPALQARLRGYCNQLESLAESGFEDSPAAAEFLGCVQLYVLRDVEGAQRSFRQALHRDVRRHRSWDLLVLASVLEGDSGELLDICQWRFDAMPTPRSSVLLTKAYERVSDETRAELICATALAVHPNDLLLNLSLAALLLKKPDAEQYLWRVQDLIKKAEKQMPSGSSAQNQLSLAMTKSIFLALSDKPAEARAALERYSRGRNVPSEVQEILRVLNR